MINTALLKKRIGYITCAIPTVAALVGGFAPANVEDGQMAFYLSILRHNIPECVILAVLSMVLFLKQPLPSYLRDAPIRWRSAFDCSGFAPSHRKWAATAPFIVLSVAVLASIHPLKNYARARYAYWFKDGLHREFQVEQLKQAFQFEAGYEYDRAIHKYTVIEEKFPASRNHALLEERIALARGLLAYAEHMYTLGKEEESRNGPTRPALDLYIESLRTNPRHAESHRRLAHFRTEIDQRITQASRMLAGCQAAPAAPPPEAAQRAALLFAVDLPEQDWIHAAGSKSPMPGLCDVAARFSSNAAFVEAVKRSWQLDRLDAVLAYSDKVLAGKTMPDLLGKDMIEADPFPSASAGPFFAPPQEQPATITGSALPPLPLPSR